MSTSSKLAKVGRKLKHFRDFFLAAKHWGMAELRALANQSFFHWLQLVRCELKFLMRN